NIVDTTLSPFALGSSQPPTETIVSTLENTQYTTNLNMKLLNKAAEYFKKVREKYLKNGILDPQILSVDVNALYYQVPGGMLSNLISQLKQQGAEDKLEDVLKEIPRVRKDFGYPPLVTPSSQIVGTQAVLNVLAGERYKMLTNETKAYMRGEYGMPPGEINKELQKKIIGDDKPITCRPADNIKNELQMQREAVKEYIETDTDVLTYCMFPQLAIDYFKNRNAKKYKYDSDLVIENKVYPV
ncbi:MAG TPA: oxaloacetate decarboxylase subunit alpha, partial [bacterium]|nr:oxaloacetate decarboxylase subunit alpha [bacterium]